MPELHEGKVTVRLTEDWWFSLKYDEPGGWFCTRVEPVLKGTIKKWKHGEVDLVPREESTRPLDGLCARDGQVLLLEIKDVRGFQDRPENLERIRPDDPMLATECALKVRDTLAGVIGAAHAGSSLAAWSRVAQTLAAPREDGVNPIYVLVLAIGDDLQEEHLGAIGVKLAQKLSWLTPRVLLGDPRHDATRGQLASMGIEVVVRT